MPTSAHFKKKFELKGFHYQAIEFRYEGKTYNEITTLLTEKYQKPFKENTVRHWFTSKRFLEKEYIDYAKKENDRRRQVVLEELKKIVPKIPLKFDALLERKGKFGNPILDMVTVSTLKYLCEILNFKVEPGNDMSNPVDEYFDRLEKELAEEG